jgi:hypothetical protein
MDVTANFYLDLIRKNPRDTRVKVWKKQVEKEVSQYRVTALKYAIGTTAHVCNRKANALEKDLKEALCNRT